MKDKMSVNVKYALERVLGLCGLKELKEKQTGALLAFINGNNIFVSLSTSYGKSITYGIVVTRSIPRYSEAMLSKTFTAFLIEVPCNFFLFTLNVPSERFASQSQRSVVISYTIWIMLGHVCSHVLIALTSYLKTSGSPVIF